MPTKLDPARATARTLPTDRESVESDNLRRINEANRRCLSALQAWENAKSETKDRKAEYEDSVDALQSLIVKLCGPPPASPDEEPLPLIDETPMRDDSAPESDLIEDTFKALLSVGHTEAQARAAIDRVCAGPRFAKCKSVSDLIDAIYQGDGDSESGPGAEPEPEPASISFPSSHSESVTLTSKHFEAIGEIEKKIRARAASSV
jgi:hypothetical protein